MVVTAYTIISLNQIYRLGAIFGRWMFFVEINLLIA